MQAQIQRLDCDSTTGLERIVRPEEATAVLAAMTADQAMPDTAEAARLAETLVGLYPAREVNDPKTYVRGLTALFAAYPAAVGRHVVSPVTGLPGRLKWFPTMADLREALDTEQRRRFRITANAQIVLDRYAKALGDIEERARDRLRDIDAEREARKQSVVRFTAEPGEVA